MGKEKYLVELAIPEDWDIVRRLEGKDFTLSGYSPDEKLFVYYCQFMEDDKVRPKKYLETYIGQFGLSKENTEIQNKEIRDKKVKFYYLKDEALFLDEKFNILFFATSVEGRNVIAYLIYPLDSNEQIEGTVRKIMLYK